MSMLLPLVDIPAPVLPLAHLDHVWFQVGGTLCNLRCSHCFNDSAPGNRTFDLLKLEQIEPYLQEAADLGVKEFYFTGGEPFLNPEIVAILERALEIGPATVLTNGTMLPPPSIQRLAKAEARSIYCLEFRVSLDGPDAATNDARRGAGSFDRAMRGIRTLLDHGFLPLITAVAPEQLDELPGALDAFCAMLRSQGYSRPRVKFLPTLRIGGEARCRRGYHDDEHVTSEMLQGLDSDHFLCSHSRLVTDRGVFVCPILVEAPDTHLGDRLVDALGPVPLRHHACFTCYQHGAICANPSAGGRDV